MSVEKQGVIGLDLSLSRTGMCFIPTNWNGSFGDLAFESVSTKRTEVVFGRASLRAREEIERYLRIAHRVVNFIGKNNAKNVSIEGYAYAQKTASVTKLAELGGVIKSQVLLTCKIVPVSIPSNTARKFVMGKLERKNQKEQVRVFLKSKGFVFDNDDLMDAFVVAYCCYGIIGNSRSRFVPQMDLEL